MRLDRAERVTVRLRVGARTHTTLFFSLLSLFDVNLANLFGLVLVLVFVLDWL